MINRPAPRFHLTVDGLVARFAAIALVFSLVMQWLERLA